MRWRQGRRSTNIEDRRGRKVKAGAGIGGGALLLIVLFVMLTGEDPSRVVEVLNQPGAASSDRPAPPSGPRADDEEFDFVRVVLASTEDTWSQLFDRSGRRYQPPVLVFFDDAVRSACGTNSAAVGPFYCPADSKVYLDLSFFRDLQNRFGAPGDFAQAYVVAHEVGHHIQNLLGISDQVHRMRSRVSQAEGNALSVKMELQADCFAGVWGYYAENMLERGDVEEGLRAAAAIGDDRIQRRNRGYVTPESWTHGSSEQRVRWFRRGLEQGRSDSCNTFEAGSL